MTRLKTSKRGPTSQLLLGERAGRVFFEIIIVKNEVCFDVLCTVRALCKSHSRKHSFDKANLHFTETVFFENTTDYLSQMTPLEHIINKLVLPHFVQYISIYYLNYKFLEISWFGEQPKHAEEMFMTNFEEQLGCVL